MKAGTALVLHDQSRMFYAEQDIKPAMSCRLLNVVVIWIPISSVMWAGIIYVGLWLFR
jgi:hypothetical protein